MTKPLFQDLELVVAEGILELVVRGKFHARENFQGPYSVKSAPGNLKHKLDEELVVFEDFLLSDYSCKKEGLFNYPFELLKTGAWPFVAKLFGKRSLFLQRTPDHLRNLKYDAPNDDCQVYSEDYGHQVVLQTVNMIQGNFDGLCLDCLDRRDCRDELREPGEIRRRKVGVWDSRCSISHDRPSWYSSWTAWKQQVDHHQRQYERRNGSRKRRPRTPTSARVAAFAVVEAVDVDEVGTKW
ncbi:hypothetical protein JHW43_008139 [Diplocarpon mali]|nr:hypothetical protein JHW43_008139 [Diplocarpon mali]